MKDHHVIRANLEQKIAILRAGRLMPSVERRVTEQVRMLDWVLSPHGFPVRTIAAILKDHEVRS